MLWHHNAMGFSALSPAHDCNILFWPKFNIYSATVWNFLLLIPLWYLPSDPKTSFNGKMLASTGNAFGMHKHISEMLTCLLYTTYSKMILRIGSHRHLGLVHAYTCITWILCTWGLNWFQLKSIVLWVGKRQALGLFLQCPYTHAYQHPIMAWQTCLLVSAQDLSTRGWL